MRTKKIELSSEKAAKLLLDRDTNYFRSIKFHFIADHCGFRKGKVHCLLSTTSAGKSTLTRSILNQALNGSVVTYYSTEETLRDSETFYAESGMTQTQQNNLGFLHEHDFTDILFDDYKKWIDEVFAEVVYFGSDLLIIDNITTSKFYDPYPTKQGHISAYLAEQAANHEIPVFIVLHTAKGVSQSQSQIIGPDDVRGAKALANTAEYFYILTKWVNTTAIGSQVINTFIQVAKSRLHKNSNKWYLLHYDCERNKYTQSIETSFEAVKTAFKNREKF